MDPISILTATSFGIQALEFLVGTAFKGYEMTQEVKECQRTLRRYGRRLSDCERRLEGWNTIWQGYKSDTYKYFWGERKYYEIQGLCTDIVNLIKEVDDQIMGAGDKTPEQNQPLEQEEAHRLSAWLRRLRGREGSSRTENPQQVLAQIEKKTDLSERDAQEWQQATAFAQKAKSFAKVQVRDLSICRRIAFILFLNTKLQSRLEQLEEHVERLDQWSKSAFRLMRRHEGRLDEPVSHEEALATAKRKDLADIFDAFLAKLYVAYKKLGHQTPWSLGLRVPDDRGNACNPKLAYDEIDLDLTLSIDGKPISGNWRRVRIEYRAGRRAQEIAAALPQLIVKARFESEGELPGAKGLLDPVERRSIVFKPMLKAGVFLRPVTFKASEEDRANLVFALVNWVILSWNSAWTLIPCCCGIRFLEIEAKGKRQGAPETEKRQYTLAAESHHDCNNPSLSDYKLLLLGLAVAELIIGSPLRIPLDPPVGIPSRSSWRPSVIEKWKLDPGPPRWDACLPHEILREVREKSLKEGIREAVEYCFDHPLLAERSMLSPDAMVVIVDKVLKPLQEFHQAIAEQRQKPAGRNWWPAFIDFARTEDIPWPNETVFEQ